MYKSIAHVVFDKVIVCMFEFGNILFVGLCECVYIYVFFEHRQRQAAEIKEMLPVTCVFISAGQSSLLSWLFGNPRPSLVLMKRQQNV